MTPCLKHGRPACERKSLAHVFAHAKRAPVSLFVRILARSRRLSVEARISGGAILDIPGRFTPVGESSPIQKMVNLCLTCRYWSRGASLMQLSIG